MSERRIDRDAWARLMSDLLRRETGGKKAPFARKIDVATRTLDRWLAAEVDVSEQSVRLVAKGLGLSASDLLIRVGYYSAEDLGRAPEPMTPERLDEAIQLTADDPNLSPAMKKRIIDRLLEMEEQDRRRRLEMARWMIEQAGDEGRQAS